MSTKRASVALLSAILSLALGCVSEPPPAPPQSEFYLPLGDAQEGAIAFLRLRCFACHTVDGEDEMPAAFSANRWPVIGSLQAGQGLDKIADSIMSPSHDIPPPTQEALSPMGSYREVMTVQQLIDLVAYVREASQAGG